MIDGPERLMQLMTGKFVTQIVATAAHLRLADALADGPKTAADLAPILGARPDPLYRLMRALASVGVLDETSDGRFSLTPTGSLLRDGHPASLAGMARLMGEGWHSQAWAGLLGVVRDDQPAFQAAHGAAVWDWMAANPDQGRVFDDAMTSFSRLCAGPIVVAYDFGGFRRIADLGGGQGHLLARILRAHPEATGVLFERPSLLAQARVVLANERVAKRVEFLAGDLLADVPPDCDVYVLKHVLHDWDDETCIAVLSRCARSVTPGGRVLVIEAVIPPVGEASIVKLMDLEVMVVTHGGRERTALEYAALFERASLRLLGVTATIAGVSVIEAGRALDAQSAPYHR